MFVFRRPHSARALVELIAPAGKSIHASDQLLHFFIRGGPQQEAHERVPDDPILLKISGAILNAGFLKNPGSLFSKDPPLLAVPALCFPALPPRGPKRNLQCERLLADSIFLIHLASQDVRDSSFRTSNRAKVAHEFEIVCRFDLAPMKAVREHNRDDALRRRTDCSLNLRIGDGRSFGPNGAFMMERERGKTRAQPHRTGEQ